MSCDFSIALYAFTVLGLPWLWKMTSTISMDEEVRLYSNNAEREKYNNLATLFGIIVALDYLERAFVRDSITAAE
jgi:ESCRT-I complex subunit VPS28